MDELELKMCNKCGPKTRSSFSKCRRNKDGLQYTCKDCQKGVQNKYHKEYYAQNGDRIKTRQKKFRDGNRKTIREREKAYRLKAVWGLSTEEYESLLIKQGGVCAICKRPPTDKRLHVDHDHKTEEIRGLLCGSCNRALGLYQDSREVLMNAVEYLNRKQQ